MKKTLLFKSFSLALSLSFAITSPDPTIHKEYLFCIDIASSNSSEPLSTLIPAPCKITKGLFSGSPRLILDSLLDK